MRTFIRRSALLAGVFLFVGSAAANAAVSEVMDVKVPFPFVANGKEFPAGQYVIERDVSNTFLLLRGENGNHASTFLPTIPADGHDPAGWRPSLTFKRSENQLRLSTVWESGSEGLSVLGR